MRTALLAALALCGLAAAVRADTGPRLATERVVFKTTAGDLVLALYPEVAPGHVEQFLRLVRLGVYDTTHFGRVEPGFVVQLAGAKDRSTPLTEEQQAGLRFLKAEFSDLRHHRGTLSMARRDDDPDSAQTSFSVLLADAPHLDGKYTIFGEVEKGMDVVDAMCKVQRDSNNRPAVRIEVLKALVVDSPEMLAQLPLYGPQPLADSTAASGGGLTLSWEGAVGVLLVVLCGVAGFLCWQRLPARMLLSLNLVGVLIGGFVLLMLLMPASQAYPWLAAVLFVGLLGMMRLMSQFESAA